MRNVVRVVTMALFALVVAGCTQAITITSEPPGARVWLNGVNIGVTPASTVVSYTAFSNFEVRLEKDGYMPIQTILANEVKVAPLVLGIILCLPLLIWVAGPMPDYHYVLTPQGPPPPPPPEGPPHF